MSPPLSTGEGVQGLADMGDRLAGTIARACLQVQPARSIDVRRRRLGDDEVFVVGNKTTEVRALETDLAPARWSDH